MSRIGDRLNQDDVVLRLCGFGPVASAAATSRLIAEHEPDRILLLGIAGALAAELTPGSTILVDEVAIYGIGAGSGDTFMTAGQLGWAHWAPPPDSDEQPIRDVISLWPDGEPPSQPRQLLTVCSAAASHKDVRDRRSLFPSAVAEDMEGFSVALAAKTADVPLGIVRGISNIAGDRDKTRWKIVEALNATADVALDLLK